MTSQRISVPTPPFWWRYVRTQMRRAFGVNVSQIDPLLFVGGQFRPTQWAALHALGIRAVLSLQAESEDRFAGPPAPRALRLLVPDFHAPDMEQLRQGVQFVTDAHRDGLPVLVHCHAGVGRAPLTAAAYLIATQRLGYREAIDLIKQQRPIIGINGRQLERLIEWDRAMGEATHDVQP